MKMFDLDSSITVEGKDKPIKARDPNAQTMQDIRRSGAAGAHKDKTKVIPRKEKYKKSPVDEAQNLDNNVEYKGWLRIYLRSPDAAETHPKHQEFLAYYMSKNQTENTIFNALNKIDETATAGATSAGNIATVVNPHVAIGNKKARKDYGIRGKQPNPPKAKPIKPTDNALDMKGTSIFGGSIKRNT